MSKRSELTNQVAGIEALEGRLAIDPHALEEGLVAQPDCFYVAAKTLALALSRRDAAKMGLEEVEAECDTRIRKEAVRSDAKITEKDVASRKLLDREVRAAQFELSELNGEVGKWGALKEAFQQRSFALSKLVDLHLASYYEKGAEGRQSGRSASYDVDRQALSTARRKG